MPFSETYIAEKYISQCASGRNPAVMLDENDNVVRLGIEAAPSLSSIKAEAGLPRYEHVRNFSCHAESTWRVGLHYDRTGHRNVCIKAINTTSPRFEPSSALGCYQLNYTLVKEARALAALGTVMHTIPRVHGIAYCEPANLYGIVTEYVEGPDWESYFRDYPREDIFFSACSHAASLVKDLKRGQSVGFYHRDLKPDNIIMQNYGDNILGERPYTHSKAQYTGSVVVRLIDIDISSLMIATEDLKPFDPPYNADGHMLGVGTDGYMSPEAIYAPNTMDHRSDIYSLGKCLEKVLFFTNLYRYAPGHIYNLITQEQIDAFSEIVGKATAQKAVKRYQTYDELLDALNGFEKLKPYKPFDLEEIEKQFV